MKINNQIFYFKKAQALRAGQAKGHAFFLAADKEVGNGKKLFTSFKDVFSYLDWYKTVPEKNWHFYEILHGPCREVIDIDGFKNEVEGHVSFKDYYWFNPQDEKNGFDPKPMALFKRDLLNGILALLEQFRFDYGYDKYKRRQKPVIKDSCVGNKVSFHLVFPNRYFKNIKEHGLYIKQFLEWSEINNKPVRFDAKIYTNHRCIRTLYSSKWKQGAVPSKIYEDDYIQKGEEVDYYSSYIPENCKLVEIEESKDVFSEEQIEEQNELQNELQNGLQNEGHVEEIRKRVKLLLSTVPVSKAAEYDSWKTVASYLSLLYNGNKEGLEVFDDFSKRTVKYNAASVTSFYKKADTAFWKNNICIGLHMLEGWLRENPEGHRDYRKKYPLPNEMKRAYLKKIIKKYEDESYKNDCKVKVNRYCDPVVEDVSSRPEQTICIKANTGMGKTKSLVNNLLLRDDLNICIINYRRSLNYQYKAQLGEKYTLYSDVKDNDQIDIDKYHKIITTIDSFWRVVGKIDILLIDESESVLKRLTALKSKDNDNIDINSYWALKDFSRNPVRFICMDAYLGKRTINFLKHLGRDDIYLSENIYKKHTDRRAIFFSYRNAFLKTIKSDILAGKNIAMATSLREKALGFMKSLIEEKYIQAEDTLFIDANNIEENRDTSKWSEKKLVIFTPAILAGISFEEDHFDMVFGWFSRWSSDYEDNMQQLNRVRSIKDNTYKIFIEMQDGFFKNNITDYKTYEKLLERRDIKTYNKAGFEPLLESRYSKGIVKDAFFYLYANVKVTEQRSQRFQRTMLASRLEEQGVKIFYNDEKEKVEESFLKSIEKNTDNIKEEEAEVVASAKDLSDQQAEKLKKAFNIEKSERDALKKYDLKSLYEVETKDIDTYFVKKYTPLKKQFAILKRLHKKNLDESIDIVKRKIREISTQKLFNNEAKFRLEIKMTHEKRLVLLKSLRKLGWDSFWEDTQKIKSTIDIDGWLDYMHKNREKIKLLFGWKTNWEAKKENEYKFRDALVFMNKRLKEEFGFKIYRSKKKTNDENSIYEISGPEEWDSSGGILRPFTKQFDS